MSGIPLLSHTPVYITVYGSRVNHFLQILGFSFCLSSVQVHGRELIFRPSGIVVGMESSPIRCLQGQHCLKSILIGYTQLDIVGVAELIDVFDMTYTDASYDPLTKNCHHFSDHFCRSLTGNDIPSWLNRPAENGIICCCPCLIPDDPDFLDVPDHGELVAEIRQEDLGSDGADHDHDEVNAEIRQEDRTDGADHDHDGGDFGNE